MVGGRSGEALPLRRGASGTIMWPLPSRSRAGIRQLGYADLGCRTRRWDSYALQPTQPGRGDSVDSARASRHHVSRHAKDWRDICSRDEVPAHHGYVTTPTCAVLVTLPRAHLSHSITYRDVLRAHVTPVDHVGVTTPQRGTRRRPAMLRTTRARRPLEPQPARIDPATRARSRFGVAASDAWSARPAASGPTLH